VVHTFRATGGKNTKLPQHQHHPKQSTIDDDSADAMLETATQRRKPGGYGWNKYDQREQVPGLLIANRCRHFSVYDDDSSQIKISVYIAENLNDTNL
jgi:hypothetical protein